ncbi:Uncharacterised protein [Arcanobacterium haemolyticum]|uniref:Uncharacterized protein n=1 Tax=Arcanobacterium haemolyticum (strain ATCC 9345 / DSM 20595 / CCM 5947 / CCUG 17215 / LMG 16163 / NBRC 15585 / NCTC 8452 / 11018) TaxID=644284 RepID=D7BPN3_ARCHD|nr:hypothetical protein Arch_1169 [Arcanobacterium haemolyticum DSM 20595]SPT75971.1 Uncharacterised protein [Arcanobacterium haemolyticum]SQH28370.1 Uncharacterised protein [Arcanobacterium haemolyticum]
MWGGPDDVRIIDVVALLGNEARPAVKERHDTV